jgi:hypothetical protein
VEKAEKNKRNATIKARMENPNNSDEQFLPLMTETVEPVNTRNELAKKAGVSNGTYSKGKRIIVSILKIIISTL